MKAQSLQRNTPKTVSLNAVEPTVSSEQTLSLDQEEAELKAQKEQLEAKQKRLDEQKQAAIDAEKDRKLEAHFELVSEAERFRNEAARATDEPTKLLLLDQAGERQAAADILGRELGLFFDDPAPKVEKVNSKRWAIPALQVGGLLFLLYFCYSKFMMLRAEIILQNRTQEIQSNPYGLDSIQKLWYEKLALGFNLMAVLGIVALFFPSVLLYMLPFFKSKKDFSTEFKHHITPWQRVSVTVLLVCALLLSLAFSPKP